MYTYVRNKHLSMWIQRISIELVRQIGLEFLFSAVVTENTIFYFIYLFIFLFIFF